MKLWVTMTRGWRRGRKTETEEPVMTADKVTSLGAVDACDARKMSSDLCSSACNADGQQDEGEG